MGKHEEGQARAREKLDKEESDLRAKYPNMTLPEFTKKVIMALQKIKENPYLTMEEAWPKDIKQ